MYYKLDVEMEPMQSNSHLAVLRMKAKFLSEFCVKKRNGKSINCTENQAYNYFFFVFSFSIACSNTFRLLSRLSTVYFHFGFLLANSKDFWGKQWNEKKKKKSHEKRLFGIFQGFFSPFLHSLFFFVSFWQQ